MFADIHHEIAQAAGLDLVTPSASGGGPVHRFGQAGVKFTVQPADKIGGINIHLLVRQPFAHEFIHGEVGQTKLLVVALGWITGKILFQSPFDVLRDGLMAFDEVGIITVHFPHQNRHPLQHER